MPIVTWSEDLSVKIKELDAQHQELVAMINKMHDAMKQGKGKEVLGSIIDKMVEYTHKHFLSEEQLFSKHNYPEAGRHSREHNDFVGKVAKFQRDLKAGNITLTMDVITFLKEWLVTHIKGTDKKYTPFLNAKGVV
ncbi:MAG: bacteriohemerythrin [Desulfobacteraceae bacterium]|nr:bacteriohemerythrin [Desulfobacteraceae bacterium]